MEWDWMIGLSIHNCDLRLHKADPRCKTKDRVRTEHYGRNFVMPCCGTPSNSTKESYGLLTLDNGSVYVVCMVNRWPFDDVINLCSSTNYDWHESWEELMNVNELMTLSAPSHGVCFLLRLLANPIMHFTQPTLKLQTPRLSKCNFLGFYQWL